VVIPLGRAAPPLFGRFLGISGKTTMHERPSSPFVARLTRTSGSLPDDSIGPAGVAGMSGLRLHGPGVTESN
jgi:hypothetical protein